MSDPSNPPPPNEEADLQVPGHDRPRMPGAVLAAVVLYWIFFSFFAYSAVLMVLYQIVSRMGPTEMTPLFSWVTVATMFLCLLGGTLFFLLAVKLRSGRNWARVLGIVLSCLNMAAGTLILLFEDPAVPARTFFGFLLACALLWLLTRPSTREWCSRPTPVGSPNA